MWERVDPLWSGILLVVAGALVAIDKFWGCSSAWARYMLAALSIRQKADDFRIRWERNRARYGNSTPPVELVHEMIEDARVFVAAIHKIIRDESEQWAAEFRKAVAKIDEEAARKA